MGEATTKSRQADEVARYARAVRIRTDSRERIARGESLISISHPYDDAGAMIADPQLPELAIGFPEEDVLELVNDHGFALHGPVHYGTWCGRSSGATYQDVLVLERRARD